MKEILDMLGKLPVLPVVVQEVIRSLGDPDVDAAALGHTIGRDPVLGARLLRVANSSFYGLSRQVATPQDAVMVMGLSQVRSLVLASGLAQALPDHGNGFDRKLHWQRSFRVATSAQALAKRLRASAEAAFTAGMLHNIGELVIDVCMPAEYAAARQAASAQGIPLRQAERTALGFDHTEVGAEVARHWKLPDVMEHAIRCCHDPAAAATAAVSASVAIACLLDDAQSDAEAPTVPELPEALRAVVPIDDAALLACIPDPEQAAAAASLLLGT
ncbi:MAG: HDOD domain-containing protein [Gammaproteobacteria bacterium]|nr:HDOD domain-containing protein [Gammaproteobacteria bacterium]MBU1646096.1 HDOD domain-containing protein [Gammaproteobacteria bacterium]MBU1972158.1 HDOD domain-containing protein [Gammaproteobacteria bacterium]